MDVVLGVSVTDTTARVALIGGAAADGDVIDQVAVPLPADASAGGADEIVETVLGTSKLLAQNGHRLAATGLVWSDAAASAAVRDELARRGLHDVALISGDVLAARLVDSTEGAAGQDKSAVLTLSQDTATLTVVNRADSSTAVVATHPVDGDDHTALLQQVNSAASDTSSIVVVGEGTVVQAVADGLRDGSDRRVTVPDSPEFAVARGAALGAPGVLADAAPVTGALAVTAALSASIANLVGGEAKSDVVLVKDEAAVAEVDALTELQPQLAYSMVEPQPETDAESGFVDGGQSVSGWSPAAAALEVDEPPVVAAAPAPRARRPFMLVGSALAGVVVAGVAALAVTVAINVDPTAEQRDRDSRVELPVNEQSGAVEGVQGQPDSLPQEQLPDAPQVIEAPLPVAVTEAAPQQSVPAPQAISPDPVVVAPQAPALGSAPQVAVPAPQAPAVPVVPQVQAPQVPVVQPPEIYLPDIDLNLPEILDVPEYTPEDSFTDSTPDVAIAEPTLPDTTFPDATLPQPSLPDESITQPVIPELPIEDFLPNLVTPDSSGSTPSLPILDIPIFG